MAFRQALSNVCIGRAKHAGLVLDRYLPLQNDPDEKKKLLDKARQVCARTLPLYGEAFERWKSRLPASSKKGTFKVDGRLIVGLGNENVLDSGLTLHHTYGVPFIPGSALKGVSSHYCDDFWGKGHDEFKSLGKNFNIIFGTKNDAGVMIFHDAWILPESLGDCLALDVITPHHADYYQNADKAPTDFDDPKPVSFLSVVGKFYVAVSCLVESSKAVKWTELTFELLTEALEQWGVGGKTSAGYGRLLRIDAKS